MSMLLIDYESAPGFFWCVKDEVETNTSDKGQAIETYEHIIVV